MKLTKEQREALEEQLAAFNGAETNIRTAMAPLKRALEAVEAAREAALQAYGYALVGYCECGKPLLTGDKAHHCRDGEWLCEDCAPTWAELQQQMSAPGSEVSAFDRDWFDESLREHLQSGGSLDDKVVTEQGV